MERLALARWREVERVGGGHVDSAKRGGEGGGVVLFSFRFEVVDA